MLEDPLPPIRAIRREVPQSMDELIAAATRKEPKDRASVERFLDVIPARPVAIAQLLAVLEKPPLHDRLIAL